ncbi:unnamed protein product [Cylindrotheca closterium]|uniref:Uncharacterized protein n=1 Tax=Cylindrotheca closterium TaxID=2856 RepID=A0AAD2CXA5_9STRA|nr:unnamed protein product [Cylindrotheca closterium]
MIHYQHPSLLSTQESLSDSTRSTIKTKDFKPTTTRSQKRKVSFHRNVLVCEDNNYSQEERNRMHYTTEEMESFVEEIQLFLISIRETERRSPSKTYSSAVLSTGLEGFLHPEHKQQHRLQGVLSVLLEQDRQYREVECSTPADVESISQLYHAACQESKEEAYQRAIARLKGQWRLHD